MTPSTVARSRHVSNRIMFEKPIYILGALCGSTLWQASLKAAH